MTIIIEGVDRIGKTTLAKELLKTRSNCDYLHFTKDDPCDFEFYSHTMRKKNVIFDRHFIGEMIYPSVFKRDPQLSNPGFINLLGQAKHNNVLVVVMYTTDLSILRSRMHTKQHQEVKDRFEYINYMFKEYAEKYPYDIIGFDVSKITLEEMVKEIDKLSI